MVLLGPDQNKAYKKKLEILPRWSSCHVAEVPALKRETGFNLQVDQIKTSCH